MATTRSLSPRRAGDKRFTLKESVSPLPSQAVSRRKRGIAIEVVLCHGFWLVPTLNEGIEATCLLIEKGGDHPAMGDVPAVTHICRGQNKEIEPEVRRRGSSG